jgi:O-antigen/teichoic acid export membrane protein
MESGQKNSRNIVLKGAGLTSLGMIYQQVIVLISGLVVARLLGPGDYGIFNLVRNFFVTTQAFAKMGVDIGIMRHVGERIDRESNWEIGPIVVTSTLILLCVSLIPAVLCLSGLAILLERRVYQYSGFAGLLTSSMLIVPCWSVAQLLGSVFMGRLTIGPAAFGEYILQPTLRLGLSVGFILLGYGLGGVVWGNVLAAVLTLIYLMARAVPRFGIFRAKISASTWNATLQIVRYSLPLGISVGVVALTRSVDIFILGKHVESEELGRYVLVQMVVSILMMVCVAFGQLLGPLVASLWQERKYQEIQEIYQQNTRWIALVTAPIFSALCWLGTDLIQIFGKKFVPDNRVMVLLGLGQLILALSSNAGWLLSMTGQQHKEALLLFMGLIVAIVMNLALIPIFGSIGAAEANLVAIIVSNGVRLIIVYKITQILIISKKAVAPFLLASCLALAMYSVANQTFITWRISEIDNWIGLSGQVENILDWLRGFQIIQEIANWIDRYRTPLSGIAISCLYALFYSLLAFRLILDQDEQASLKAMLLPRSK